MKKDVDMVDTPKRDEKEGTKVDALPKPERELLNPTQQLASDIQRNIDILQHAVLDKDLRLLSRVLRSTGNIRKRMTLEMASKLITTYIPDTYPFKKSLLSALAAAPPKPAISSSMEVDTPDLSANAKKAAVNSYSIFADQQQSSLQELAAYLHLIVVLLLLDHKRLPDAVIISKDLVTSLGEYNRRTLDEITARSFFYYARAMELSGDIASIRTQLLSSYRTATLRHDSASQAVLLNLLLRNYIAHNLYDQADKLLSRTQFPETRSNNQLARFMYYTGRVKAIQLDYLEALWNLQQALRKAPQHSALGFRISAQKFMIIVQLLTGEVPARDTFRQPQMQRALRPYLTLTQAVRVGDMQKFKQVVEASADEFESDQTMSLIVRLRHNVIKTGLRMLNASYSRISLSEICKRLHLDSAENAEGVVAKAIHDDVIDAVIDHEGGFIRSNETMDVYSTTEPTDMYHSRIQFCLKVYNEAIKAMRFPEKREDEETPEQRRERLKEQEELAKTLAEEDDDDFEP